MCEILIKAVDARMPTVAEWRSALMARIPEYQKYLDDHADVPAVEANHARLVEHEQAKSALSSGLAKEAKTGKAVLTAQQKLDLAAKVNAYESAPLTKEEVDKARLYCAAPWEQRDPKAPTVSQLYHYYKHQVEVEAARTDADKGAELSAKDRRGCYKLGDPVVVMPDGHEWGAEEGLPKFYIVKIPGLAVETAKKWIQHWEDTTDPAKPTIVQRRLYRLKVADIPTTIRKTLQQTGQVTVTLAQIRNYVVNQRTGAAD